MKLLNIIIQVTHTALMESDAGTQKFYTVVAVIATLFVGIVAYLIVLEGKIKKLEDKK